MKIIVAVDSNWGIGANNGLLFNIPADMAFFKEKTMNKVIAMGGNTLLSFPNAKPLPKRINIVLSDVFTRDDCKVFANFVDIKNELKNYNPDDIFIVGGAMFYNTMLPYCSQALITKVKTIGDATHFFPNIDSLSNWKLIEESEPVISNGYEITFCTYKNNEILPL